MAFKKSKYRVNRHVKAFGFCTAIVAIALLGLHIWFVNNARNILKAIVEERSNGKIKLELSHVRFNFFSNQLQIQEGDLASADTITATTSYHVKFNKLTLRVRSFWPLLLQKNLKLDSINIHNPIIEVVQRRKDSTADNDDDLSITEEMGRVYGSALSVLKTFGIRRILVDNASLKLVNKIKPGAAPVWITKINLNVLRKPEDSNNQIAVEEVVNLTSSNQTISFANQRNQLAFKNFKLQLFKKRIELDSCTITAFAKGISKSSYTIFFKKLWLVGVDFAAMGSSNLIRADSVYCENPLFNFNIVPADVKEKKAGLDMKKLVREFTSDLDLAYVGVKNAGIHLNLAGTRPRSISNSNKDNFEVRGLKVNADSALPVSVDRFDMLVRDYHLYNVDSSAIFGFDSIHFLNNKILLNNFTVVTTPSKLRLKSTRDFRFPFFELSGLDWYELIFNQNVKAREAMVVNPVLRYTKRTFNEQKKTNFFATLQNLDDLMTLDRLNIVNGSMYMNFGKATRLDLYNVNLKVSSNDLLAATSQVGLQKAVDYFSMSKGVLRRKDLTGQLINVTYKPNNLMYADKLVLNSTTNNINAVINDVFIDNMILDDRTETIYAKAVQWKGATVDLRTLPAKKDNRKSVEGSFDIHNIMGNNTFLILNNGVTTINSSVGLLKTEALTKINNGPAKATGLHFLNNTLSIKNEKKTINALVEQINVDTMLLRDEARDILANGVRWNKAQINITDLMKSIKDNENAGILEMKNIEGTQTGIYIENAEGKLETNVDLIKAGLITKTGNENFVTDNLLLKGHAIKMNGKTLQASADAYQVAENSPSFITNLLWQQNSNNDTLHMQIPGLNFAADVNSLLTNNFHLSQLAVTSPTITLVSAPKKNQPVLPNSQQKTLIVDTLFITQPNINYTGLKKDSNTIFKINGPAQSAITASHLGVDENGLSLKTLQLHTQNLNFTNAGGTLVGTTNGKVDIDLRNITLKKESERLQWQAQVNNFAMQDSTNLIQSGKNKNLLLKNISAANLFLSSTNTSNINQLLTTNTGAVLQGFTGQFSDSNNVYAWYNAGYNNQLKKLHVDSFSFKPLKPRDTVIANLPYQADYVTFATKAIDATGFNLDAFNENKAIIADSILLTQPVINIYRDKLPPLPPDEIKPLPAQAIAAIGSPVFINTIQVKDGLVSYTEKNEKSRAEGELVFANMNGTLKNIKNYNAGISDSLQINLQASLMNSTALNLKIAAAYADTGQTFLMKLQMAPVKLSILNPVMVPLSNVKITNGTIDTLFLEVIAKDYFAAGNINMFYKNLRIKLVQKSNANRSGFKNNLLSFMANTLLIKNNNTTRQQTIYFERMRSRSFFNYLFKIAFSGMATSIGVGSSNKNFKAYQKQLEARGLSHFYFDGIPFKKN